MKLLFVNSCPRGEQSRTLKLARTFLSELERKNPDLSIIEHDLCALGLEPVTGQTLAVRESVCDARDWSHPMVQPALDFLQADLVLIAAPYWDLSFPSVLKVWIEHMYVRNLTFHYENDQCIGHCRARRAVYITTAGSPIGMNDWGAGYIQAVMKALGIPEFSSIRAEALDLDGSNVQAIMNAALEQINATVKNIVENAPQL